MKPYRPSPRHIPELNGLRVLLVFIVSWYHIWQQSWWTPHVGTYSLDFLVRAGYVPVDGTILLSGFLLFLPHARAMLLGEAVPDVRNFYQKRIMRIVPSYVFVTLLMLFAVAIPYNLYWRPSDLWKDLLMHLTFTQTFDFSTYIATLLDGGDRDAGVFDLPPAGQMGAEEPCRHLCLHGGGSAAVPLLGRLVDEGL